MRYRSAGNGCGSADNGCGSADNGGESADNGCGSADNGGESADNGCGSADNGCGSAANLRLPHVSSKPRMMQKLACGPNRAPVRAQRQEHALAEHDVAIASALAITNVDRSALAIDIADAQVADLAHTQPGPILQPYEGSASQSEGSRLLKRGM